MSLIHIQDLTKHPVLGLAWKLREFSPYPMTIFDGAFRFVFTYVIPIGFVAFYPSQLFLPPKMSLCSSTFRLW